MSLKPFKIYGTLLGPNPFKVATVLSELSLPYEVVQVAREDIKGEAFTALNPNGRLPALVDPNKDDFTIWESGAIVNYLITEYDTEHKLSFPVGTKEYHLTQQWLHFQMSGQGPYYGQWFWFKNYHSEQLPSAVERYANEVRRVTVVLDKWLENKQFLVGDKYTFADLAFFPWQMLVPSLAGVDMEKEAPNVHRWMENMKNRPAVAKVLEEHKASKWN
ncbi:Glutathione S-transferase, putative [Coccidioides posadasii C735 delta SOWgp]|uniref:glutathione transferase n=1 Tax=Coccidioides posadasii (strain C735) TaxID=222929 RepID=C5PI02_COCP7|nr:Glutathione S-transferase, putative [Coccidioides posadasii C735 delta SOWgp]EER24155.1 Glutathione S-transferase, putative [Coccidioides posadasii C735 delta SOWgp]|eukprot:XP_003066300.1 Glutathione S-transferase, putative [Coccidioides posadasii C735 delta SOWgp]